MGCRLWRRCGIGPGRGRLEDSGDFGEGNGKN